MIYHIYDGYHKEFFFDTNTSILFFDKTSYEKEKYDVKRIKELFVKEHNEHLYKDRTIRSINLIPSMKCNGQCLYCYNASDNNTIDEMLTVDVLDRTLKNLPYKVDIESVRMYGGEPLLNPNIVNIINYFKNVKRCYISRGLFIDEDSWQKLLYTLPKTITIGIGVDLGTEPSTRVGRYANVDVLIDRGYQLSKAGYNVVYANTVSKHTDIKQLFFDIQCINTNYIDIAKSAAFRISIACDKEYSPTHKQVDQLYKEMLREYTHCINPNLTSNLYPYTDVIYAPNIYKLSDTSYFFKYSPYYCGVFNDMVTILPNGKICHCHMNITDDTIEIDKFKYKESLINPIECKNCDHLLQCRGGCLYRRQITNLFGDYNENIYCKWIKHSFELSLYRLFSVYGDSIHSTIDSLVVK